MGYDNEFAAVRGPMVFDVETAPLPDAAQYLEPVQAAKNLKDPEKVAADIEARKADRDALCGLDYNVSRIVCIGMALDGTVRCQGIRDEEQERVFLELFWIDAQGRRLIGFKCREFDLPMLIQRSRYLSVKAPQIDLGRYSRANRIIDLYDLLTFQDSQRQFAMRRTLHSFCKRFGIPVEDTMSGADIAALVAAGDWDGVIQHCASDVALTRLLAERLGVLPLTVARPQAEAVL